ncbi:MAG: Fe2+-dependent dioxygenase [Xanthobacteraceae bacterium]
MVICIGKILNSDDLAEVCAEIEKLRFVDGRRTAGWAARLVKDNEQAEGDARLESVRRRIEERILDNEVFQIAARPKALTPVLISRYSAGKQYGTHVDDALMQGMRTDLSFTLFLANPAGYDGGELVIESSAGEQPFKLEAGSMILYPTTTLHRVEPVSRGMRVAAFGWVRSFIRSAEQREILFDLETARRGLFEHEGKTPTFDLLSKCNANLLRMWAED